MTNLEELFYKRGYFVVRNLFSAKDVQKISASFDRLQAIAQNLKATQEYNGSHFVVEGNRIDRIVWMAGAEPNLLSVGEDSRILEVCSELLHVDEFDQLICQGHYKLPGDNVKFDWHQDCQHRRYGSNEWTDVDGRGSYVQTLMAIDEVTLENGPVKFIPDTVKLGYMEIEKHEDPTSLFDISKADIITMKPGDVAFFHPYAVHGSEPNNSNSPRRVFINGFASPGANKRKYPGKGAGRRVHLERKAA
jgi:ectoine hydroxylase-related dioxygenase (phytanoyl-CoA dioxygenase family)